MPLDSASDIAKALDSKSRRPARKAAKARRPRRESLKTITTRLYSNWSELVRTRAGMKCEVCGREHSSSAPLNAHHIMPRQSFTGLRFDPDNGIALCPKCHKMGKFSAHRGGIWFADWLRTFKPGRHDHCLAHKDDELDCKDRRLLYLQEVELDDALGMTLPQFEVRVLHKDGSCGSVKVTAHNAKAAEYIAFSGMHESPVKGIVKVEKVKE